MGTLPKWASRAQAIWTAIGSFLILIGAQGAGIPTWITDIFSQSFVDAVIVAAGAVITFYQFVRAIFIKTDTSVKTLSSGAKASYFLNPFKIAA